MHHISRTYSKPPKSQLKKNSRATVPLSNLCWCSNDAFNNILLATLPQLYSYGFQMLAYSIFANIGTNIKIMKTNKKLENNLK